MGALIPLKEAADFVRDMGGKAFELCYQCGLCSGTCPWNLVRSFSVRRLIHQARLGLAEFESEDLWLCATCGACIKRCPRGVEVIDIMRALRKVVAEAGVAKVPDSLGISVKNIASVGNPLGEAIERRVDWAQGLGVKGFAPEIEWLYFPCCIPAYDPKAKRIAQASAKILQKLGINFGTLGEKENCCGESIRKSGNEEIFGRLAKSNIQVFTENKVEKVVVTSPHCYYTFKNEYPVLGGKFEVAHLSQLLAEAIENGKLKFSREIKKGVIYHDPCYLGRHSGIYEQPRLVLKSIPGLKLIEFPDSKEDSICCGGGGGRIWMETKKGERFSDLRLEQALEAGAKILALACPYCFLNFEDSRLSMEKETVIEVKDISELVLEAIS